MIRTLEFDVCELAPTMYLAARDAGIPITALPIFLMRRFHHGDMVCRPGSGISAPKERPQLVAGNGRLDGADGMSANRYEQAYDRLVSILLSGRYEPNHISSARQALLLRNAPGGSGPISLEPAGFACFADGVDAVARARLRDGAGEVVAHRPFGKAQDGSDFRRR
jgi:hypothetical protein